MYEREVERQELRRKYRERKKERGERGSPSPFLWGHSSVFSLLVLMLSTSGERIFGGSGFEPKYIPKRKGKNIPKINYLSFHMLNLIYATYKNLGEGMVGADSKGKRRNQALPIPKF